MSIVQSGLPLALSMPFILVVWVAFLRRGRVTAQRNPSYGETEAVEGPPSDLISAPPSVDLEVAIREALIAADPVARSLWVRMDLAVDAAMTVPVDPGALRIALRDILLAAINATPGGQVLVTAVTLGRQLRIRITDDGPGADQRLREASMRQTEAMIALQGGSIAIEARPGRGTSVVIRLPVSASAEEEPGSAMQLRLLADQAA
jgi:signal transduction histidine kinase